MLDINSLPWVEDKIHRHCVWAKEIRDQFRDDSGLDRFVRLWLVWLNRHSFIELIGESGVVIWRPCATFSLDLANLSFFDLGGECLWVDFLHAPEQWPAVRSWLISTGKKYGGWQRRENFTLHTIEIAKLCSRHIDQKVQLRTGIRGSAEHCGSTCTDGESGSDHVGHGGS
jgi:hypothetical protein